MVFIGDSSGRFLTSYVPNCLVTEEMKKNVGITDNYNYRLHMQRNAVNILNEERQKLMQKVQKPL